MKSQATANRIELTPDGNVIDRANAEDCGSEVVGPIVYFGSNALYVK